MDTTIASGAAFAVHDDAFLDVLGPSARLALLSRPTPTRARSTSPTSTRCTSRPSRAASRRPVVDIQAPRPRPRGGSPRSARTRTPRTAWRSARRRLSSASRADAAGRDHPRRPRDRRARDARRRVRGRAAQLAQRRRRQAATARSGSPTRATATLQGFRPSRSSATPSTATTPRPGDAAVVADCFDKPNGLAFSPGRAHALRRRQRRDPGAGDYDADLATSSRST